MVTLAGLAIRFILYPLWILLLNYVSLSLVCNIFDSCTIYIYLINAVQERCVVGPTAPKQIALYLFELAKHGFVGLLAIT